MAPICIASFWRCFFPGQVTCARTVVLLNGMGVLISKRQVVRLLTATLETFRAEDDPRRLGVETQRRSRHCPHDPLLGLFSLVALWAAEARTALHPRMAAWYVKDHPTFSDAIAYIGQELSLMEFYSGVTEPSVTSLRDFLSGA
jgi:hypothetical protein